MANETKNQELIRTREQRWGNGFYTFEDARAYLKESGKNKSLPIVLFVLALIDIAAILSFFFIEKQPLFLLAGIPYLLFLIIISFKGINNSFGALIGFAFVGFFVSGFIVGGVMLAMLKLDVSLINPLFPGIVAACITFTTFLWGCHRCFVELFNFSKHRKQKKIFVSLRSQKGSLSEQEYDLQILANVTAYNEKINAYNEQIRNEENARQAAIKAEKYYKSALDNTSLTDMIAAADLGFEKAKRFLEPFAEILEWIRAKDVNYSGLFASIEDPKTGKFVNQYLKTCEISENCGTDDLIRLREHGNPNAGRLLAVAGDHAYKQYKGDGVEDPGKLKYITKTLCSPNALIEEALVLYREAKFQTASSEEAWKKLSVASENVQQGWKYAAGAYRVCAIILYYDLVTIQKDLQNLRTACEQIEQFQKDNGAKALFDSFGLDMDYICSKLLPRYERLLKEEEESINRWWFETQQKKMQEQAQQSSEFDPTRNYGDYLVATSIDVSDI